MRSIDRDDAWGCRLDTVFDTACDTVLGTVSYDALH